MLSGTVMPNETKIINVADQKWRITALAVYQVKTGWLLRGKLSSPNSFGLPPGHILISIIDSQGTVIECKEISYKKSWVALDGLEDINTALRYFQLI
jgi:hypothetical protein